ncbi:hypothetical protein XA68_17941 [Ophiocordyceps unilateralis]|uniref:Nucleoporin Nup54 alpha-helical domain-containing protein n=1 Tax=Ophiocordyceps unilateralis TaxID=268505 RepID=A0A2A9P3S5_OPHUN|nr:hypothetical protein XA68_17941 [Ophiocordyceps unilateralis]
MSLAPSASGPSALTIKTGAANSLSGNSTSLQPATLLGSQNPNTNSSGGMASLFGATQQKPAPGLFGSTSTAQPAAGGFFSSANATSQQQPAGNSLFGGANTQQQQQQQQQQQPAASGGLFGNTSSNAQQQQQQPQTQAPSTGGPFGIAGGQQQQQQQQPQQQSSGLFGQQTAQQQSTQPSGGLFGASTTTSTQPSGGLFGATTTSSQPAGGLFGASTANAQPAVGGGLFGQSQAKPSGGLIGQAQAQPTNQVPAVRINYDNLRPRTRFDDLAQPVQDEIALIDKGIQRVIKMRDEIGEFMPQHEKDIQQLGRDVKFVESKFRTVQVALNQDIQTIKVLQDLTKKNISDAQLSFKAADNLKLPTHYHQTGLFAGSPPTSDAADAANASSTHASAQDLITYFNRVCDDVDRYKRRLDEYRSEIERDMPGVENGLYEQIRSMRNRNAANGGAVQVQLGQVLSALRETGNAIVAQAGQIADTRERLSRLQAGMLDSGLYATGVTA